MKPRLIIPSFLSLCVCLLFTQCEKEEVIINGDQGQALVTDATDPGAMKGPPEGKGPGGGGHTEVVGNNLSFPVLLADGAAITPIAAPSFTVPYLGPYTGLTQEEIDALGDDLWYAQKVEGNVWQADYATLTSETVYFIDWGDAIESVDPKVGRPYRLELALFAELGTPLNGYTMALLANPSSPDEIKGTNNTTYASYLASITSPKGRMIVQRFEEGAELTWNADYDKWDGAEEPITFSFSTELNVSGKYIFGASKKGWKPSDTGNYRITFYMDAESIVDMTSAVIGDHGGDIPKVAENNQPMVDATNNLTYVDVQATTGGGGGGGH